MSKPEQSNSVFLMRKLCDQIQQEIHGLEYNQEKYKTTQKLITQMKDSMIRIISSKLPKIMNIQEKYSYQIHLLEEELGLQKQKNRDIFQKYETQILQNDKMKIQTLQVSEGYENAVRSYEQMRTLLKEAREKNKILQKKEQHNTSTSTILNKVKMCESHTQTNNMYEELQNAKRKLYEQTIKNNQEEIQEMRQNSKVASERIKILQQQNRNYILLRNSEKEKCEQLCQQNIDLLKRQKQLAFQAQQAQQKYRMCFQKMQRIENLNQQQQVKNSQKNECIKVLRDEIIEREQKVEMMKIKMQQIQQLANEYETKDKSQKQEDYIYREKYTQQNTKLKELKLQMNELQQKYEQKMAVMNKYIKEQQEKNKHNKSQIKRLYQAMDQHASKQLRYSKKLQQYQIQKTLFTNKIKEHKGKMDKVKHILQNMNTKHNIISEMKEYIKQQVNKTLVDFSTLEGTLMKRIMGVNDNWNNKRAEYDYKIRYSQTQSQQVIKRCVQTENHNKMLTRNMIQMKQQMERDKIEKDSTILKLQMEVQKQTNHNNKDSEKLSSLVSNIYNKIEHYEPNKYQKEKQQMALYQSKQNHRFRQTHVPISNNKNMNVTKELQIQKIRLSALQKEYESLLHQ